MEITPKAVTKFKSVYSTPDENDANPGGSSAEKPKLSASLRERLKRSRRSFTSPVSVAKRLCVDDEELSPLKRQESKDKVSQPAELQDHDDLNTDLRGPDLNTDLRGPGSSDHSLDLIQQREQLKREVKDKTETLRRLNMVKMYRSKNDLSKLQSLIDKWRSCAQAALYELQSEVTQDGRKASLPELIDLFGLDDNILHFDRTEEDFIS